MQQHIPRTEHEINSLLTLWDGGMPETYRPVDPIEHAATVLSSYVLSSPEKVAILKFDLVSTPLWRNLFEQMERLTSSGPEPMIYLEIDQEKADLYARKDQTAFYRWVVETFLSKLKNTPFSETNGYSTLANNCVQDFSRIYRPFDLKDYMFSGSSRPPTILDDQENIGANLKRIVQLLTRSELESPFPIINITTLPDLPAGSVEPIISTGNLPGRPVNEQQIAIENRISFVSSFMQSVYLGGGSLRKLVAVPGWTIEVLRNGTDNQQWNRSSWSESGILEELLYRRILSL